MIPVASIVIPLRRQVDTYLEMALRSAISQTVPTEVVVVTAEDTPRANLDIVRRYAAQASDRVSVVSRPRPGYAVALNTGFQHARADRVSILLSDDWLESHAIEASVVKPHDIVSGGTRIWREDAQGWLSYVHQRGGDERSLRRLSTLEEKARYIGHLFVLSRELVLRVGGVDETLGDLSGVDDYDLIWCMLEAGASVAFVKGPLYNVRDHDGERLTLMPRDAQLRSLNQILDKHSVTDPARRAAIVAAQEKWFGRTLADVLAAEPARARAR